MVMTTIVAVADEAHRLEIGLASLATSQVEQHQLTTQGRGNRQPEQEAHRYIDQIHEPRLPREPTSTNT
jgi:hypothetical protein